MNLFGFISIAYGLPKSKILEYFCESFECEIYNSVLCILLTVRLFGLFICHLCFVGKFVDFILQVQILVIHDIV